MDNIKKIIEKLYPDGVKIVKMHEVVNIYAGKDLHPKRSFTEFLTDKPQLTPYFKTKQIQNNNFNSNIEHYIKDEELNNISRFDVKPGDLLFVYAGTVGKVAICTMNGVIARAIAKISVIDSNIISEGFVKHWLLINEKYFIENAKGAAIKKFALGRLNEFKIPIPPIEIQNKIVDILDNFQELTSELISELTKELLSRKEQYHYYHNKLLSFDNHKNHNIQKDFKYYDEKVQWDILENLIISINSKIKIDKKNYLKEGEIPIIDQSKEFIGGYYDGEYYISENEVIVFGDHTCILKYINFNFIQGADGIKIFKNKKIIILKFLYYFLKNNINYDGLYSRHWSKIKSLSIPIPRIEIQTKIVEILDHFDKLCNDISKSIPAEIKMRQEQYEYYRNKLLTF